MPAKLPVFPAKAGIQSVPSRIVPPIPAKVWLLSGMAATGLLVWLVFPSIALAHQGIVPGRGIWESWNPNPLPSLALFLAAYLYLTGLNRWPIPSHPVRAWQRVSFFAGLLAIFVALQTPVDPLAEHYFSIHQAQHLVLRMIGPVLILLGAPMTPMLKGLPPWALFGLIRPLVRNLWARRAYLFITNPILTTLLFLGFLYLWQVPTLHGMAVRNDYIHELMHSSMLISGFLFWWLVIDPKPHRSRLHPGLRVLYLGLIIIPNTLLGAGITFNGDFIYDVYTEVERPFELPLLIDQQLGGLLLWVVGDMMSILVAGIVMVHWFQQEEQQMNAASS